MRKRNTNFSYLRPQLRKWCRGCAVAVYLIFFLACQAHGQTITGRVVGTVQDSSQAPFPNAEVTLVNQNTGIASTVRTDALGNYVAPSLPAGVYRISVQASGFRNAVSADNIVSVAQTLRADFTMEVGTLSEVVEVKATGQLVQSVTSELGQTVNMQQIQMLPLNGRLFGQLVQLTPGAFATGQGDGAEAASASGGRSAVTSSVNGLPWAGTQFTIDGVTNMELGSQNINISPPLEAIEEFKVQSNNPGAEFGGFGGAIVNLTMRSGTNEIHGSLFEYIRNEKLNARTFFAATKPGFKTNQFGGTVGGPIIKNKAFFFGDYQGMRMRQGSTTTANVPTQSMRQGIFSTAEGFPTIYDPSGGMPFPDNTIPASRFDQVAAKVKNLWPEATQAATAYNNGPVSNFTQNLSKQETQNQVDLKGDYQLGTKVRFFVRESFVRRQLIMPSPGNRWMMGGPNSKTEDHNAVIGYSHVFSPTVLNELRLGFNRFDTFHYGNDYGVDKNNELGIKNGNLAAFPETSGIATFSIANLMQTGSSGWTNGQRLSTAYQISDGLTRTKGSHTMKFGADLRQWYFSLTNPQLGPRGVFSFDTAYTSNKGSGGAAFASFLLGYPTSIQRDFVNTRPYVGVFMSGLYAQDDYRVSRNLTLNLGLRWDVYNYPRERYNRQTNLDVTTGLLVAATPDNRGPNLSTNYGNWGPRFGFAYSPDNGKTAIRSAFGYSYFTDNWGSYGATTDRNYPLFQIFSLVGQNTYTPWSKMDTDGLPGPVNQPLVGTIVPPAGISPWYMPGNFRPGAAAMWNFGIQRQITQTSMIEAAYVGTKGTHLFRERNIDVPFWPGAGNNNSRRPYYSVLPQIQVINQRGSDGDSEYNALQLKYTKRLSAGLQALISYTWSKVIDDMSIFWVYDDKLNRGVGTARAPDRPNILSVSYNYDLPVGKGRRWLSHSSRVLDGLAGGWTLNGITTALSGAPLTVTVATSLLNTGTTNRANVTCTNVSLPKSLTQWFDGSCFAAPAQYVFGNAGQGLFRGPGVVNFDLSAFKKFNIDEKRAIEFRAESFNLGNKAHFSNPGTSLGSSSYGRITGTTLTAREMQLGLKLFF
jgi:hypothetical protein